MSAWESFWRSVHRAALPGSVQRRIAALEARRDDLESDLAAVQGQRDVRHVMEGHGLPRACWVPRDREFGWTISRPKLFEHDGTLWACYAGQPGTSGSGFDDDKCTWTPRKLSEFHAAFEAFEAAAEAGRG